MFSYNTKPKQKPTYSSGNAVHTQFLPFELTFQPEVSKDLKQLEEFPGSLVVKSLCFHFNGPRFDT